MTGPARDVDGEIMDAGEAAYDRGYEHGRRETRSMRSALLVRERKIARLTRELRAEKGKLRCRWVRAGEVER